SRAVNTSCRCFSARASFRGISCNSLPPLFNSSCQRLSNPVNLCARIEGFLRALKNIAGGVPRDWVVNRPPRRDRCALAVALENDDLLRVGQNGDVGVVGHNDDLPPLLGPAQYRNEG